MTFIKTILLFLVGIIIGFGFWYIIFWFITTEPNLLLWHWATKIVYLFFAFASMSGILDALFKD